MVAPVAVASPSLGPRTTVPGDSLQGVAAEAHPKVGSRCDDAGQRRGLHTGTKGAAGCGRRDMRPRPHHLRPGEPIWPLLLLLMGSSGGGGRGKAARLLQAIHKPPPPQAVLPPTEGNLASDGGREGPRGQLCGSVGL